MKFRLSLVTLLLIALVAASPASALCVKCISVECWAKIDATARDCSSYGTACATIGRCDTSGSECGEFSCGPDQQTSEKQPLAMDYMLASVRVEHVKARTAIAQSTVPAAAGQRQ